MNKKEMQLLNALVADIDCLEPLYKWANEINIFQILHLDRTEIRHSNMLSWLISPQGTHGLGDKFLKKILIYATNGTNITIMNGLTPIDIDLMDLSDAVIYREKDHIDILLVSEQNHLVLAIENKIGTQEYDNQLNRYRDTLCKNYGENMHYVLIFLSPEGSSPSDTENWVNMGYPFVLEELSNLLAVYNLPPKSQIYIEDYMKAIRRNVVEDRELKQLCQKIYLKHKEAFDLIFENMPDVRSELSDFIYAYLKENESKFHINIWEDGCSSSAIRFTPLALVELYGYMGSEEWYHNKNLLGFEIRIFENDIQLAIIIGPSREEYKKYRQALLDAAILKNWKMRGKTLTDKWKTIRTFSWVSKNKMANANLDDLNEICEILKTAIDRFFEDEITEIIDVLKNIDNEI